MSVHTGDSSERSGTLAVQTGSTTGFASSTAVEIESADCSGGSSGAVSIGSDNAVTLSAGHSANSASGGGVVFAAGHALGENLNAVSSAATVASGSSNAGPGGQLHGMSNEAGAGIVTAQSVLGYSGEIDVSSGLAPAGRTGTVGLTSGNGLSSGNVSVQSGLSVSSGPVVLSPGPARVSAGEFATLAGVSASGSGGSVHLQAGSASSVGQTGGSILLLSGHAERGATGMATIESAASVANHSGSIEAASGASHHAGGHLQLSVGTSTLADAGTMVAGIGPAASLAGTALLAAGSGDSSGGDIRVVAGHGRGMLAASGGDTRLDGGWATVASGGVVGFAGGLCFSSSGRASAVFFWVVFR